MRWGIVGRNFIVDRFIEAGKIIEDFEITALYSRNLETGKEFAQKHGIENIFTDLEKMRDSGIIDGVYIASPNYIHWEQSLKFLEKGIPVLCEKPLASNAKEVTSLLEAANLNNTFILEAMRIPFNPKYEKIKEALKRIAPVRGVFANFCQYSSRYDSYKDGVVMNAFKRELSNGSLMDIGVYGVAFIYGLFGKPEAIQAQGHLLATGVDGSGNIMLKYPGFTGVINHSKISNSNIPSEIQGEKGTITIGKLSLLEDVVIKFNDGTEEKIQDNHLEQDMYYEIKYFMDLAKFSSETRDKKYQKDSLGTIEILDECRKQVGVVFPADK